MLGDKRGEDRSCLTSWMINDAKPLRMELMAMTRTTKTKTKTIRQKTIGRCQTSCQIGRMINDVWRPGMVGSVCIWREQHWGRKLLLRPADSSLLQQLYKYMIHGFSLCLFLSALNNIKFFSGHARQIYSKARGQNLVVTERSYQDQWVRINQQGDDDL